MIQRRTPVPGDSHSGPSGRTPRSTRMLRPKPPPQGAAPGPVRVGLLSWIILFSVDRLEPLVVPAEADVGGLPPLQRVRGASERRQPPKALTCWLNVRLWFAILTASRDRLDALVKALLKEETISFLALLQHQQSGRAMTGNPGLAPTASAAPGWTGFRLMRVTGKRRESLGGFVRPGGQGWTASRRSVAGPVRRPPSSARA